MSTKNPHCYLEFTIGAEVAGRVVIELFYDLTPLTAENFRGLCTGEYGKSRSNPLKALHYVGCQVHRVMDKFMIQLGDITKGDGSGGESIYEGKPFKDENFTRRHAHAGLLSMANKGANSNSSQFFITLEAQPHLDGKHVVFGQVVDGMDVIRRIGKVPTNQLDRPRVPVTVFDCGELESDKKTKRKILESKSTLLMEFEKMREKKLREKELYEAQKKEKIEHKTLRAPEKPQEESEEEEVQLADVKQDKFYDRRLELMMKMNEARKLNNKAVIEEKERINDPLYLK